jgi:hypothetical protein
MLTRLIAWVVVPGSLLLAGFVGCGGAGSSSIDSGDAGGGTTTGGPNGTVSTSGGVNPADAGPGGNTSSLACGNATCAIPGQVCCLTPTAGGVAYGCEIGTMCAIPDAGAGNNGGNNAADGGNGNGNGNGGAPDVSVVTLACTDTANCPAGSVCCATRSDATGTVSACQTGTTCSAKGNAAQLCDPTAPAASNGCPAGQPCTSANVKDLGLPASFGICGKG